MKHLPLVLLMLMCVAGCSKTIITLEDGTRVESLRVLDSTEIGHVSYDGGSFVLEGYKSDMSIALRIIDKLIAEREEEEKQFTLKGVTP